ncbi:MAG: nickel/cobalt transporter [Tabrizicola sp.]
MRRALTLAGLVLVLVMGALWASGALAGLTAGLGAAQRAAQEQLAGAIRALRAGDAGALAGFWALCLGYGVLHAAGPGHGKLVIGGYGLARRVPVARLAGLALAASMAQAAVAVALVYGLVGMLGLGRQALEGAADRWVTPVGHAMIAGLGLWLVWRGVQDLRRQIASQADAHGHHDHHHDHAHGPGCTHAHGPTVEAVERVGSFRDGLALVAGIALRPCSGALFVLVLTWQLGIALAGIVGAFVMGLGTALVTVGAAVLSVWAREGAFLGLGTGRLARVLPVVELAVGAAIAVAALGLLAGSL